ncbi:MAG: hypothetical protein R2684_11875 [Pyrinomonadaceae bacterium]
MRNTRHNIAASRIQTEHAVDGGGIALTIFLMLAVWLLLFQSNIFR